MELPVRPSPKRVSRRLLRSHVIGSLLLIALVVGIQINGLWHGYQQYQKRTQLSAQNLGIVLGESIVNSFQSINLTLLAVIDDVKTAKLQRNPDVQKIAKSLDGWQSRVPGLAALRVVDASGYIEYGNGIDANLKMSVADRDYFKKLVVDANAGMVVSKPLLGRIVNKWILICARRINTADGGFGGIVYGTIELEGMAERLSGKRLQLGEHDVFTLRDTDNNVVLRYEKKKQDTQTLGQRVATPREDAILRTGATDGFITGLSPVDHIERIFYFQKIAALPLTLNVGLSVDDAFSGWRRDAIIAGITAFIFVVFTVLGSRLIYVAQLRKLQLLSDLKESNRKLAELSTTDGLTGIANRRRFDQVLTDEWRRAARNGQPLAVAMIDVDLFKSYNDHYGHQQGDSCLRNVARIFAQRICRAGDLIARYGGEEFAFIGPAADAVSAQHFVETIRLALEKLALPHAMSPMACVTVSVGLAVMAPVEGQDPAILIKKADEALYQAKAQGRNRVVVAQQTLQVPACAFVQTGADNAVATPA
jgi:diguanylate cyclase (GGDEF)-like protein